MAAFVSSTDIDAAKRLKKEKQREMRENILKDAREDYERKKKREELKRVTGEDKWIAPGVSDRLGLTTERKRKKKSKKEHKKSKKSKRSKHSRESASSGSESSDEMWVEKSDTVEAEAPMKSGGSVDPPLPVQRDEWMVTPLAWSARSNQGDKANSRETEDRKEKKESKVASFDKPGQHPLELNPFWKEGGSGLPQEEQKKAVSTDKRSSSRVYDGGRSWILRSYKRALEQAETEGKSLEEIASVRWGSLDKLYSLLQSAGIDPDDPDKHSRTERREYLHSTVSHSSSTHRERRECDYRKQSNESRPTAKALGGYLKPGESKHSVANAGGHHRHSDAKNWQIKKPKEESSRHSPSQDHPKEPSSDTSRSNDPQSPHRDLPVASNEHVVPSDPVTDSQLNAVAAKLMKAELLGDDKKIKKLKEELETLRKLKQVQAQTGTGDEHVSNKKTVVLAITDRFGRVRPVDASEGYTRRPQFPTSRPKKGKQKHKTYDDDGEGVSLKSLMEEERRMTAEDTHAAIARMASKFVPAANEDETVDDALDSKSATRYNPAKDEKAHRDRAIFESRKMTEILENCRFCFGNRNFDKHLLVAVGIGVYLAVPSHQSLTEGHCLLIPMEHTVCSLQMDENVWSEVQIYQKGLTRMFSDLDMDVIFTESYMSTSKKSHMYVECIPMPKEEGSMAPMYFKKAIQESDVEWSENKKLVDTRQKGVRNSIPVGLPYFYVDFGVDGGYAHIIEDQSKFPHYFAKEIVGGMLDVEPRLWLKPPKESFERQKVKVNQLSKWWEPYDWTQKLKQS